MKKYLITILYLACNANSMIADSSMYIIKNSGDTIYDENIIFETLFKSYVIVGKDTISIDSIKGTSHNASLNWFG